MFKRLKYKRLVPELYRSIARPPSHSKAVVIGSGFGGAITALRLAQAGIQTTVLERGQDWPIDNWRDIHTDENFRDGRGLWRRTSVRSPIVAANAPKLPVDKFGGVLDLTEYPNMEVWRGACVGGGSKVFTGVMIQPQQEYFDQIFQRCLQLPTLLPPPYLGAASTICWLPNRKARFDLRLVCCPERTKWAIAQVCHFWAKQYGK